MKMMIKNSLTLNSGLHFIAPLKKTRLSFDLELFVVLFYILFFLGNKR